MYDTQVTVQGWVGGPVTYREVKKATDDKEAVWVASFRLGSTARTRRDGEWVDGETGWYSVSCWRSLGRNVAESVRSGDAVVVTGRLRTDTWQRDGVTSTTLVVDAVTVGHDLNRGVSAFSRPAPHAAPSTSDQGEPTSRPEPVAAGGGWGVPGGGATASGT